jgi:hypothetical protein
VRQASATHPFVDAAFVKRVLERVRHLNGQWRSTRFGDAMAVRYHTPS